MALVQSVNVGVRRLIRAKSGSTGIHKVPTSEPVTVSAPGPKGSGASGLAGDVICDTRHHGGDDQAVYAYAREDLDWWQAQIGDRVVLQVTSPRIPCATFAVWMNRKGWLKAFTRCARPGAYLRVLAAGDI